MAAHKGHKKAGGRKEGTGNKTTSEVRAMLQNIIDSVDISADLNKCDPATRLQFVLRLLPYIVPKYRDMYDLTGPPAEIAALPVQINITHEPKFEPVEHIWTVIK
jgi:hypothetical protein